MKKLLLIALLIVGCDKSTEPQDCTGVISGTAVLDDCGVCDSDSTNDGVELWGECYDIETTTILDLSYNQLSGSIPSEIGQLTHLAQLWLKNNELTGEIPSEIGNLTNIEVLSLSYNQLTGEIPPEIGNLTNLELLSLRGNQLTGEIPPEIGQLTNLTYLGLDSNQLTGLIPEEICNLNLFWASVSLMGLDHNYGSTIFKNQLCPPYPSCKEDYVGEQDTSNCP